ncbi:alpha-1,3-glucan synthase [Pseudomassariella vexata]|uniref:alpha-1,3-glucan synthase n=1 Tax=Pseudomassariella vexata TaxID=1141098 RepID=A0A1Y2DF31_9PEZI|nr:alpha-1,3-glucan synthase [Pseudomassariella vexata]ORY57893.1 alpha-1,3-glucan synthase [Pseudomassariella vexata]
MLTTGLLTLPTFILPGLLVQGLRFDPAYEGYNLNENPDAENPLDYWGEWEDHTYNPSPESWRFPFYTLFLDRFVNGDPTNDNANGTLYEQDIMSTQLRHGGDLQGLVDSLDYIQGMGVRGLYIAGSPFINQPWVPDSYSVKPLDHTLLDFHYGNITEWRYAITEIHKRGMYILLDNTVATMGDLIGFDGYLNESTPFKTDEHAVMWKGHRRYHDFNFGVDYNETCDFPRLWDEKGYLVGPEVTSQFKGCYNGDFDQFGDTEAFGVFPDYRRQLTKFASVQDRLREWVPSVQARISHFSCIAIAMLDIDGFRYDKATQVTLDASGHFSSHLRACARRLGKENFFLPGEITGGNTFGSLYVGRGRQPDQYVKDLTSAASVTNESTNVKFLRDENQGALDAAAFHYSIYRSLTRFLGMDGNLEAGFDLPHNWVDAWNQMMLSNDFLNPNTGLVDPRHMFGVTNQDVFRWPGIQQGIERMLLGQFITTLHMPGIPLLLWGEEQAYYLLDSTADNYIYGRQSMSSSPAWEAHGCYKGGSDQYYRMPLDSARRGCQDPKNSWDHRDPSHPIRNIIKAMYRMRLDFPTLRDGLALQQLSNQTEMIQYPGSSGVQTETGLWSVVRSEVSGVQSLGSIPVWLVYHNRNESTQYTFDCSSDTEALISPYSSGISVKNLFFPHDELMLVKSPKKLGLNGSEDINGCSPTVNMLPYEFKAYVPTKFFVPPPAMITKFLPGHDFRIPSQGQIMTVKIEFHASAGMDCDRFTDVIEFNSITSSLAVPQIDKSTIVCNNMSKENVERSPYVGAVASAWSWSADVTNFADGIHEITVRNATTIDLGSFTNSVDRFLLRIGTADNPLVFPSTGNYSSSLLMKDGSGTYSVNHNAPGASKWRYSLNWASTWSDWMDYKQGHAAIERQEWSGTNTQSWPGHHVIVQYWSQLLGSSSFVQHGDFSFKTPRRFPHLFANGPFNQFGFDAGLRNELTLVSASQWEWHFMDEWPSRFQLNVWGMNPDMQPDQSFVYGDIDGDFVLDRLPPSSLVESAVNVTDVPPSPYLSYRLVLNDGALRFDMVPAGNRWVQLALYILLWIFPLITGCITILAFRGSFYKVKFVERGLNGVKSTFRSYARKTIQAMTPRVHFGTCKCDSGKCATNVAETEKRRMVLIGTMEYNIDDWNIRIKIGGLGVMAQLMGKSLTHQDLIWVVPCVGGIEYPIDEVTDSMFVVILGKRYEIKVQYHKVENITYVLLDAPVFRKQSKAEPYPPRMDDLESAIYYSAWNQCIAQAAQRFPIDLYHINDYHGAAAPLYLLPKTIPCALSLHNAEFQGMWPMRTPAETKEVCEVYNLDPDVVAKYVQYGSVFNLLHAGASYLRVHQDGFGAVGVSKKYGDRSFARYPIFWGLTKIGQLPNPDPTDTAAWDKDAFLQETNVKIDNNFEAGRAGLRRQAQEWAGLEVNPEAELFVFVGRWSLQKGIDLIADIFPSVLEQFPETQLICVGPVIDLYGKFAALKLSKLMEKYPERVFSKPEFTALPPCIFSGAEFALIPSRDEPFGLVAVEFGRKGALGVGARVGGLGQMPGWWFTVESMAAAHLLAQFREAIVSALATKVKTRAMMRAWSAKQRFPVAQWLEKLDELQSTAIKVHEKPKKRPKKFGILAHAHFADECGQVVPTVDVHDYGDEDRPGSDLSGYLTPQSRPGTPESDSESDFDLMTPASVPVTPGLTISMPTSGLATPADELVTPPLTPGQQNLYLSPTIAETHDGHVHSGRTSALSLQDVVGDRSDFNLLKVDPFFTDSRGEFYDAFDKMLQSLNSHNSTTELCIEDYLVKSEKEWFTNYRNAKLGRLPGPPPVAPPPCTSCGCGGDKHKQKPKKLWANITDKIEPADKEYFGLADDYKPPSGLKKHLQRRVWDWPIYGILLAIGQIISSNSYQITLLTGELGQTATKLYVIATIYLISTIVWYVLSRTCKSLYVLCVPFFIYGFAFFILGLSPFASSYASRGSMQNVATGFYAVASSSGGLAFALNFGDEGGSPLTVWILRATVIQGFQQVYAIMLWYWGSLISSASAAGYRQKFSLATSPALLGVCFPISMALWATGVVLFAGLPDYYRETPGALPMLWRSLLKRRTVMWYFFAVVIQNYFLSAPYGRNWFFLFSSQHVPTWAIALLALAFFGVGWVVVLKLLSMASRSHSWLFPLFAVGLGAPRWAQMLWGTSGVGLYLPWTGSAVSSALTSRALWLWLGLLDGIQGAGIGMILMLVLTRAHVAAAIVAAQVIGSVATMVGRASAPDNLGPGDVFPDFSEGAGIAASKGWFWVVMLAQLVLCVGFFKFFRKEQVSKP